MTVFDRHEIVSRVEVDGFGSWLMRQPYEDGNGWSSSFWVRVTAADQRLVVVGDIKPTVFAHGPSDPVACVRWMGLYDGPSAYVMEKAAIGTGNHRVWTDDVDVARKQLNDLITECGAGSDEAKAARAGIAALSSDDDPHCAVRAAVYAVLTVDPDALDGVSAFGQRPHQAVVLAIQALNRLVALLDREATP